MTQGLLEEKITGVLERILFANEETHYCIAELRPEKLEENTIIITGNLPSVQCGETLALKGQWITHPQYGKQFKIASFESKLPSGVYGIRKYLGSGLVRGIGKTYANKIVDHFGERTFQIISEESARLQEVEGIGKQRVKAIKKAWDEQKVLRDTMIFLKTYGITDNQCLKLVQRYDQETISVIKTNPYVLIKEIKGIGFKTADKIALNLGFASDCAQRLKAGIIFILNETEDSGHTAIAKDQLLAQAIELLQVSIELLEIIIQELIKNSEITLLENNLCQRSAIHRAEHTIANSLFRIHDTPSSLPSIVINRAIDWAQEQAGFQFAPEQTQGIECSLKNKLSIITGGPGTGKTTLLRALVKILKAKKVRIVLAAPTGRAAQRMTETTGAYAQTIHRLLKFDHEKHQFTHNNEYPLQADFVIIDESSMLDTFLGSYLLNAIPAQAHVLLVGDVHQLPSVGPGKLLQDFINSEIFNVVYLKQVFRQSDRSNIVSTAHDILEGLQKLPPYHKELETIQPHFDLHFIEARTPEACIEIIKKLYVNYLPKWYTKYDPCKNAQILAPMHKGIAGIGNLNAEMQKILNASKINHGRFKEGDKVIQTRNNYELGIFNGDLGQIQSIDPENGNMVVLFDHDEIVIDPASATDLYLAYAITIHKSQGSEFPITVIPLLKQHFVMLQRNLLYTAITRGRKKVFIVGDPSAYFIAINNKESTVRVTHLESKLRIKSTIA